MNEKTMYWPEENLALSSGFELEVRARIALQMIEHFAVVAGKAGDEDSSGRSVLQLQTPEEVVALGFAVADLFVDEAEKRGLLRGPQTTFEECAARAGRLEKMRQDSTYERLRQPSEQGN